jgi:hypothetical protein
MDNWWTWAKSRTTNQPRELGEMRQWTNTRKTKFGSIPQWSWILVSWGEWDNRWTQGKWDKGWIQANKAIDEPKENGIRDESKQIRQ